jgi:hypothetical protein
VHEVDEVRGPDGRADAEVFGNHARPPDDGDFEPFEGAVALHGAAAGDAYR